MFSLPSHQFPCQYCLNNVDNVGPTRALIGVLEADPAIENDKYPRNTRPAHSKLCAVLIYTIGYLSILNS